MSLDSETKENNIIKFNVGGKIFPTTLDTLKIYPESILYKIATNKNLGSMMDEKGNYFINRDPKHFRLLLNFMAMGNKI